MVILQLKLSNKLQDGWRQKLSHHSRLVTILGDFSGESKIIIKKSTMTPLNSLKNRNQATFRQFH